VSFKHQAGVLALVTALASPALAVEPQQSSPDPRQSAADPSVPTPEKPVSKPVRGLFLVQPATPSDPLHLQDRVRDRLRFFEAGASRVSPPRTVCGLTIWNVDPNLDPRMRLTPPQPPNVTYTIQKITPPVCGE